MAVFVLVHGAWHGGWCWRRVTSRLRGAGHEVWTPTLTGLGERAHLLSESIDLETHIEDVLGVLQWEDLHNVVLCGHSYGGMVITGVSEQAADRLDALVYLDAFVPEDGQCVEDLLLPERLKVFRERTEKEGDGWRVPPVPAEVYGVTDEKDQAWVDGLCVDQPAATFRQKIRLGGRHEKVRRRSFILAGAYEPSSFRQFAEALDGKDGWTLHELPTGHDAMITMPAELAELLAEIAA